MKDKKLNLAKFPNNPNKDNIHPTYALKEYKNMAEYYKRRDVALKCSDNGRCWWVYQFIIAAHTYNSAAILRRR